MEKDERISVTVSEDYSGTEEDDTARFAISTEGFHVFITRAFSVEGTTVIGGLKLWYLKRTRKTNFEILGENRLVFGCMIPGMWHLLLLSGIPLKLAGMIHAPVVQGKNTKSVAVHNYPLFIRS